MCFFLNKIIIIIIIILQDEVVVLHVLDAEGVEHQGQVWPGEALGELLAGVVGEEGQAHLVGGLEAALSHKKIFCCPLINLFPPSVPIWDRLAKILIQEGIIKNIPMSVATTSR